MTYRRHGRSNRCCCSRILPCRHTQFFSVPRVYSVLHLLSSLSYSAALFTVGQMLRVYLVLVSPVFHSRLINSVLVLVSAPALPGHCQEGRVTALLLTPVLSLTAQFYCCHILLLLHCKPNFEIISKLAFSVLKENTHLFIIFTLSFEHTFQWCSEDVSRHLAGQEARCLFADERLPAAQTSGAIQELESTGANHWQLNRSD